MLEADVAALIREYVETLGGRCERCNSGTIKSAKSGAWVHLFPKGWPDLLLLFAGGAVVWVETKAPDKKLSPDQIRVHNELRELGQTVLVADSLEKFIDALAALHIPHLPTQSHMGLV